jgi:hypothetical protein
MLAENKPQQQSNTPATQDHLAVVKGCAQKVQQQLIEAEGGCYNGSEVAKLLRISEAQLDSLRAAGKIIGLPAENHYLYPKWQIVRQFFIFYQILPHLEAVLERLGDRSPWVKAAFMLDRQIRPEFSTPLAGLQMGKVELVLAAAESFGNHGAS